MRSTRTNFLAAVVVTISALGLAVLGCESSSGGGGGDTTGGNDGTGTGDAPTLDLAVDGQVEMAVFQGKLVDFQTREPIVGATVTVLNNDDGKTVIATVTSLEGGVVTFNVPAGIQLGLKCELAGYRPTYQFNIASDYGTVDEPETLWIVSDTTWTVAPGMAGLVIEPGKGQVAGALYYRTAANEEVAIGCGTVQSEPSTPDIRYFGNSGLPTTLDLQPTTNPDNAFFFAANVPAAAAGAPTETVISGWVGTTRIGSVRIFTYPDSMCISNIYRGFEWDPAAGAMVGNDQTECPAGAVCDPNGTCP